MQHYIYFFHSPRPTFAEDMTDEEAAAMRAHGAYLDEAMEAGHLLLAGRTLDDAPTGLALFRATDDAAAKAFFDNDPAVIAGVVTTEVHPFRVAYGPAPTPDWERRG